jgi:hypothetical protein
MFVCCAAQKIHCIYVTNTEQLMPFSEIIAVCCENHMEHINTLCGKNLVMRILNQLVDIVTSVL